MFSTVNLFQMFKPGSVNLTVVLNIGNAFPTLLNMTACSYCIGCIPADVYSGLTWKHSMLIAF